MAAKPISTASRRKARTTQTDDEFLTSLISFAKLPDTEVVKAQLTWILEWAADPDLAVRRAPYAPGGYKTLREMIVTLRKSLLKVQQARTTLIGWSMGTGEEASFYREAIWTALEGSTVVPEEMVRVENQAHFARCVERLLPRVSDELVGELRKVEEFASKRHVHRRYNPNERTLVHLLWLVFETSGRRVTLRYRGSARLSPFQQSCVKVFDRAKLSISQNFPNRIIDAVTESRCKETLDRVKGVIEGQRGFAAADVPMVMSVWRDWLLGFPIPEMTSDDSKKSSASP